VCGARRPCKRRERRLTGRALAVGVRKDLGGLRCLTLRYSLLLSVWVDPSAEHIRNNHNMRSQAAWGEGGVLRLQSHWEGEQRKKGRARKAEWKYGTRNINSDNNRNAGHTNCVSSDVDGCSNKGRGVPAKGQSLLRKTEIRYAH